ncbi:CGNR zinc finger domain-containing protein [Sphaerisporangium flaviroseum]
MTEFFGGVLCLDFANSLDGRRLKVPKETLFAYGDLAQWALRAGVVDQEVAERLLRRAAAEPGPAQEAFNAALELRETVFHAFHAIARGTEPAAADLAALQDAYRAAMAAAHLVRADGAYGWAFDGDDPNRTWWPVARSAIELLTAGPVDRVRVCASSGGCAGLFLDLSKNRSRRWCSMSSCGVEVKTRRQNARRRATRATGH